MNITEFAAFLEKFGGWGMTAVLIIGIVCLYRSMSKLLEKRNDQFREILRETSAFLQQNAHQNQEVEDLLRRIERILDNR